jgi:putative SOS response-associated peptidase YedK
MTTSPLPLTNEREIRALFSVRNDCAGNLPPLPSIFPDQLALIVRVGTDGERELTMTRWACRPRWRSANVPSLEA